MWPPSLTCIVCQYIIHVNIMSYEASSRETSPATRLDRCVDRSLSRRSHEEKSGATFETAAGSAPRNRALGEFAPPRLEGWGAACAASRPPTPTDGVGWAGRGV